MSEERYTLDLEGDFDELVMENAFVHIERMDDGHIWALFSKGSGETVTLDLHSSGKRIDVVPQNIDGIVVKDRSKSSS